MVKNLVRWWACLQTCRGTGRLTKGAGGRLGRQAGGEMVMFPPLLHTLYTGVSQCRQQFKQLAIGGGGQQSRAAPCRPGGHRFHEGSNESTQQDTAGAMPLQKGSHLTSDSWRAAAGCSWRWSRAASGGKPPAPRPPWPSDTTWRRPRRAAPPPAPRLHGPPCRRQRRRRVPAVLPPWGCRRRLRPHRAGRRSRGRSRRAARGPRARGSAPLPPLP